MQNFIFAKFRQKHLLDNSYSFFGLSGNSDVHGYLMFKKIILFYFWYEQRPIEIRIIMFIRSFLPVFPNTRKRTFFKMNTLKDLFTLKKAHLKSAKYVNFGFKELYLDSDTCPLSAKWFCDKLIRLFHSCSL